MTRANEAAGVWVRVSTGGQDEAQQVPAVEGHCDQHGYTIAKRYELNDRSASKGEQQAKRVHSRGLGLMAALAAV